MTRVGIGFDVHCLVADRPLILCGISIPFDKGLLGHSDADVATHALCDAMLGANALGDIGQHFPDNDPRYQGIDSQVLLAHVVELLHHTGYEINNVDLVIIAERPKVVPYVQAMRERLALTLKCATDRVSIKATTTERLGFVGRGEGIAAQAVVTIERLDDFPHQG